MFIALENSGVTFHKGVLLFVGCLIGGALALFTIVLLMPHMDAIASLVVVVAFASAIAGWVAKGTEFISCAGLQIAFAFFLQCVPGFVPAHISITSSAARSPDPTGIPSWLKIEDRCSLFNMPRQRGSRVRAELDHS